MVTSSQYHMPAGMCKIPDELLDLRPDADIDQDLLVSRPVTSEKNVWFYWHQGYANMHPYTQRNVRAWYRRLTKQGWAIRVIDRVAGSPLNIEKFLDTKDLGTFPQAYIDGTLTGTYALQHGSDLIRFPLLLRYGGVYADVGFLQIGDLDRMWRETAGNPHSPYEVFSYGYVTEDEYMLMNYFMAARKNNPLFQRCHKLLLALWSADGGRLDTSGMYKSPLLQGTPLLGPISEFEDNGRKYTSQEASEILTDYIIQGQVIRMVMSMVDPEDRWDGPAYTVKHVYALGYEEHSQLINEMTAWNGTEAFRLMSLRIPDAGETESDDQAKARHIVEECLSKSFGFKLATGLILKVLGETLSSRWRRHVGSDDIEGTYAHWLRYGMVYWTQVNLPPRTLYTRMAPFKTGPLTRLA